MIYGYDPPADTHHLSSSTVCVCLSVCVYVLRPVCHPPCCRAAAGPGRQGTWWRQTGSAAAVGSAVRECTPTPAERKMELIIFICSEFWNAVCGFGFWKLTFSSAAPPLVLFLISGHEDKVIKDSTTAVETGGKATLNWCEFNPQLPLFLALHQTWLQGFAPIWLQEYRWSLARSWHCSSAQMCWMGRKLGLYPGQPSTTNCESHFFIDQTNNADMLVKANGLNRLNCVWFWYIFIRIKGHLTN